MLGTELLGTKDVAATIAVKDIAAARQFYGETLGLKETESKEEDALNFQSGDGVVLVYKSKFAGTNKATSATWVVGKGIADLVQALKARGVVFERYDLPGIRHEGDLHVWERGQAAWFKDPDGNILCLASG